jgi:SAM-dependent MidA family methyltransferase
MTLENIKESLQSQKSEQRRKAAAEIGKQKLLFLGNELFDAYVIEKRDSRTWETKVQKGKS